MIPVVDPGSKFFQPRSRIEGQTDSVTRIRINSKELIILPKKIPDTNPDPDLDFLPIPDPGSSGQKGTRSRIRIPGNTGYVSSPSFLFSIFLV
jgi:hypothetical protein